MPYSRPGARRAVAEQLASTPPDTSRVVLATGRYAGEGFDDGRLDTLLLAMPIAWKGTVVQYVGRLHRAHPGKHEALVYDYVDAHLPVLRRMFAKRLKVYRALGYELLAAHSPQRLPWTTSNEISAKSFDVPGVGRGSVRDSLRLGS
jgi:superfamily II DNA or RNA helicase